MYSEPDHTYSNKNKCHHVNTVCMKHYGQWLNEGVFTLMKGKSWANPQLWPKSLSPTFWWSKPQNEENEKSWPQPQLICVKLTQNLTKAEQKPDKALEKGHNFSRFWYKNLALVTHATTTDNGHDNLLVHLYSRQKLQCEKVIKKSATAYKLTLVISRACAHFSKMRHFQRNFRYTAENHCGTPISHLKAGSSAFKSRCSTPALASVTHWAVAKYLTQCWCPVV